MTWFKIDDRSHHNPKVLAAGNEAWGAFCRAGAWSAENLTDGAVPSAVASIIAPKKIWKKLLDSTAARHGRRRAAHDHRREWRQAPDRHGVHRQALRRQGLARLVHRRTARRHHDEGPQRTRRREARDFGGASRGNSRVARPLRRQRGIPRDRGHRHEGTHPARALQLPGLPHDYIIDPKVRGKGLSPTSQVRLVGNSVPPTMARVVVQANIASEIGEVAA